VNTFVRLRDAGESCGAKAAGLGMLARAGFAVPDGVVLSDPVADGWRHALPGLLRALGGDVFAVRSSAAGEDGRAASFAGQYGTSLNVPADRVEAAVRRTADSLEKARVYAAATGQPPAGRMSVIVQQMLCPCAAGVAFTRHPVTGGQVAVVEAVTGLGDRLVSGRAAPQRWQTGADGRLTCSGTPGVLTAEQAGRVARVAQQVEALLGGGQDVEWAITDDGRVWVLQARPITTTPGHSARPAGSPPVGRLLARGTPAGPGTARGRLCVVRGLDDFASFAPGEVLVCRATSPAWTPLLARAAAVVTEGGGVLAHAAIVARELRIPAVTDVPAATSLPGGTGVVVDGSTGTVTTLEET
jgi:pyruvate,water dikinase